MKAIVLDVDDTTLVTWNYEIFSNWAYNPATNATFVTDQSFPAVPGMVNDGEQGGQEGLRRSSSSPADRRPRRQPPWAT